ncbi:MAG: alginate lyase family protein [Promethearchaeota archaeon]
MIKQFLNKIIKYLKLTKIYSIVNQINLNLSAIRYVYFDSRLKYTNIIKKSILQDFPPIKISEEFKNLINNYLEHKFDLLGSKLVKLDYNVIPIGIENHKYDRSLKIKNFDKQGLWLEKIVYKSHIKKSKRIWQLIDHDYSQIDWQQDFKSGYRISQRVFSKRISVMGIHLGLDLKIPWELARGQHFPQMAIYAISINNEKLQTKILKEFKNQILDFIMTNPIGMGVNWVSTMDIAIRAVNWLFAYDLFTKIDKNEVLNNDFKIIFYDSIYAHGIFIRKNLEWVSVTNNHYLSDIAGLFIIALYLDHEEWFNFKLNELRNEIKKQFYEEGTNFEASTCYHRLATELIFYPVYFAVLNQKSNDEIDYIEIGKQIFGKEYIEKLYKIFDSFHYLLKPNGNMPQIGDNDSGQFFKLYPREILDMRYLLATSIIFFKESKWKIKEFFEEDEDLNELKILFGEDGLNVWKNLEWSNLERIKSNNFDEAGWFVLRNNGNYVFIACGLNGQSNIGGHCHNDKLSFELMINKKDIIVDSGTYLYTALPEFRNKFRSVKSHNTVIFIDEFDQIIEQNKLNSLFSLSNQIKCKKIRFLPQNFVGKANHESFELKREFKLLENGLEIKNEINIKKGKDWYNHLIFAPGVNLNKIEINNRKINQIDDCYISLEYGTKVKTNFINLKANLIKIEYKIE